MGGGGGSVGWVGDWLDQVGIRLTQLSTGLKVEAELGNNGIARELRRQIFARGGTKLLMREREVYYTVMKF